MFDIRVDHKILLDSEVPRNRREYQILILCREIQGRIVIVTYMRNAADVPTASTRRSESIQSRNSNSCHPLTLPINQGLDLGGGLIKGPFPTLGTWLCVVVRACGFNGPAWNLIATRREAEKVTINVLEFVLHSRLGHSASAKSLSLSK